MKRIFKGLIGVAAVLLSACGGIECSGDDCQGLAPGGNTGGTGSPVTRSAAVWRGTTDVVGAAQRSITLVTDGGVWRYLDNTSGERVDIYFDSINTAQTGSAFIHPRKGGSLSSGSSIDSGPSLARFSGDSNLSGEIDFRDTGDQAFRAALDVATSQVDASLARIAGRYAGTASDGTQYSFEIFSDGRFVGTDSNGCRYNLTTTFRESSNLYSSSGNYDPTCESGGANFIDAAFWDAGLRNSIWFVRFRALTFTLQMVRQ